MHRRKPKVLAKRNKIKDDVLVVKRDGALKSKFILVIQENLRYTRATESGRWTRPLFFSTTSKYFSKERAAHTDMTVCRSFGFSKQVGRLRI